MTSSPQRISLRARTLSAGSWTLAGYGINQILRLAGNLILARLLFPEAFGLLAVVNVLMTGFALFSDLGISQAIVKHHRGEEADFLNTAWTVQITRGIFISLLAIGFACVLPFAVRMHWVSSGTVYANPSLPWILGVFSLTALIQGFESTKIAVAQRKLQVKAITQLELFSQIVALIIMIVLASQYRSIWALVAGAITAGLVRCIAGHLWLPGEKNKFHWDFKSAKEILHFGKWIFLLSIIGFLANSGDRIVLGGFLDPAQMGLYSVAFLLSNAFAELFTSMLSRIIFPAVSEVLRDRPEDLARVYHRLQMIADFCLFGAAGFLFAAGEGIVKLLYDQRYHAAGPMLTILALGLIAGRYGVVYQFCLAMGSMRYLFATSMTRIFGVYVGVPLGFDIAGIEGALIAVVASQFIGWPVAVYFKVQHGLTDWKRELVGLPVFCLAAAAGWAFP